MQHGLIINFGAITELFLIAAKFINNGKLREQILIIYAIYFRLQLNRSVI